MKTILNYIKKLFLKDDGNEQSYISIDKDLVSYNERHYEIDDEVEEIEDYDLIDYDQTTIVASSNPPTSFLIPKIDEIRKLEGVLLTGAEWRKKGLSPKENFLLKGYDHKFFTWNRVSALYLERKQYMYSYIIEMEILEGKRDLYGSDLYFYLKSIFENSLQTLRLVPKTLTPNRLESLMNNLPGRYFPEYLKLLNKNHDVIKILEIPFTLDEFSSWIDDKKSLYLYLSDRRRIKQINDFRSLKLDKAKVASLEKYNEQLEYEFNNHDFKLTRNERESLLVRKEFLEDL